MNRTTKKEKALLQAIDSEAMNAFRCEAHGIFALSKAGNDNRCRCCKKECKPIVEPVNPHC